MSRLRRPISVSEAFSEGVPKFLSTHLEKRRLGRTFPLNHRCFERGQAKHGKVWGNSAKSNVESLAGCLDVGYRHMALHRLAAPGRAHLRSDSKERWNMGRGMNRMSPKRRWVLVSLYKSLRLRCWLSSRSRGNSWKPRVKTGPR